jgi:outer membrane protein OmpA-like peptidoglycan-associated protein
MTSTKWDALIRSAATWRGLVFVWFAWGLPGCESDESRASDRSNDNSYDNSYEYDGDTSLVVARETPDAGTIPPVISQTHTADGALARVALGGTAGARISARMDGEAEKLRSDLQGLTVERIAEGIKITMDVGTTFDPGSDRLAPETMDYLSRIAVRLTEFSDCDLLIVGHTDRTGDEAGNLRLSEERALKIVEYLASEGIARTRMSHVGRGGSEPLVVDDQDESHQRANRRIEIAIFAGDSMKGEATLAGTQP